MASKAKGKANKGKPTKRLKASASEAARRAAEQLVPSFWLDQPVWLVNVQRELTKMQVAAPRGSSKAFKQGAGCGFLYAQTIDYIRVSLTTEPILSKGLMDQVKSLFRRDLVNTVAVDLGSVLWDDTLSDVEEHLRGFAHGIMRFREGKETEKATGTYCPLATTRRVNLYIGLFKNAGKIQELRRRKNHHKEIFDLLLNQGVVSKAAGEYEAVRKFFNRIHLARDQSTP